MTKFLSGAGRRDENHREERKDGRNAKALAAAPQASAALGRVHLSIQRRTRGLCVGPRLCVPLPVRMTVRAPRAARHRLLCIGRDAAPQ